MNWSGSICSCMNWGRMKNWRKSGNQNIWQTELAWTIKKERCKVRNQNLRENESSSHSLTFWSFWWFKVSVPNQWILWRWFSSFIIEVKAKQAIERMWSLTSFQIDCLCVEVLSSEEYYSPRHQTWKHPLNWRSLISQIDWLWVFNMHP